MRLTKEDIEWVGYHRFNKEHERLNIIVFGCLIVALLAVGFAVLHFFPNDPWAGAGVGIPIAVLLIIWIQRIGKAQRKATAELLKQCELDPHLIYVPDKPATVQEGLDITHNE